LVLWGGEIAQAVKTNESMDTRSPAEVVSMVIIREMTIGLRKKAVKTGEKKHPPHRSWSGKKRSWESKGKRMDLKKDSTHKEQRGRDEGGLLRKK